MGTENKIDERIALPDLLNDMLLLHHAAAEADDHTGLFALNTVQMTKSSIDVLIGIFPDGTCVVYNEVGIILIGYIPESGGREYTAKFLGVTSIHLTAESHNAGIERSSEIFRDLTDQFSDFINISKLALRFRSLFFFTF